MGPRHHRRGKGEKNPIAWVISHAEHHGNPSPQLSVTVEGAAPTPAFTCAVRYLDHSATRSRTTKDPAKTAAADGLVDSVLNSALFA